MSDIPMKLIVDLSKSENDPEREQYIPFTAEEIAQREEAIAQFNEFRAAREAEEEAKKALKESAKAKLIAGQPLTEEEASVLVL